MQCVEPKQCFVTVKSGLPAGSRPPAPEPHGGAWNDREGNVHNQAQHSHPVFACNIR